MNEKDSGPQSVRRPLLWVLFGIAVVVVGIDQVTKALAVHFLEGRPSIEVLGELAGFTFIRNPGAALGLGANFTWIFPLIAVAVLVVILVMARKLGSKAWAVSLGLLLGGLFGNLIDRLVQPPTFLHGAVVDFIDLHFFICNVADIAITAAAVTLVLTSLRGIELHGGSDSDAETGSAQPQGESKHD